MTKENTIQEMQVMEPVNPIEVFKAQLAQSLELSEKLIVDLDNREREIELFSRIRESLENTLKSKDQEIEQLKNVIKQHELEKFNSRMSSLADSWIQKYGLSEDKKPEVIRMLTTFQNEEDLGRVERLLGLSLERERQTPVALTKNSDALALEQFRSNDVESGLSREERINLLWTKLAKIDKNYNP